MRAALVTLALGAALLGVSALGARSPSETRVPQADGEEAVATLREFMTLATHLAKSGDERFAERIPASPDLVEEILADVAFAAEAGRSEDLQPVQLQIEAVKPSRPEGVEVLAKEYWVFRTSRLRDVPLAPQVRADVVRVRYVLAREGTRWRVVGWNVEDAIAPRAAGQGG